MTTTRTKHIHRFITDSHNKSVCKCGRVEVSHIAEDMRKSTVEVLREGNPNYVDPEPTNQTDVKINQNVYQGKDEPVPPKPKNKHGFGVYWETNKPRIISDMATLGMKRTKERWGIWGATWMRLRQEWKVDKLGIKRLYHKTKGNTPKPTPYESQTGRFVSFPEFNEAWKPEVQMKWMEIYVRLAELQKG